MWRTAPNRRIGSSGSPRAPSRCRASVASHGSRRHSSTTSSSGHTDRSAGHGSLFRLDPGRGGQRGQDQTARERELDVRAHAVPAARARPEPGREALGEPALDPSGGHGDHVGRERILERIEQRLGQAVGETVRALGSVNVKHV